MNLETLGKLILLALELGGGSGNTARIVTRVLDIVLPALPLAIRDGVAHAIALAWQSTSDPAIFWLEVNAAIAHLADHGVTA